MKNQAEAIQFLVEKNEISVVKEFGSAKFVCYFSDSIGAYCMAVFFGRRKKAAQHYKYSSRDAMIERMSEVVKREAENMKWEEERKAKLEAKKAEAMEKIQVGTIFSSSWGYEQTNVDFFMVVEKPSKGTVIIRELGHINNYSEQSCSMSCTVMPDTNNITGDPIKKKINKYGGITFKGFNDASIWDGKAEYKSWYY